MTAKTSATTTAGLAPMPRLRPPAAGEEAEFRAAHEAMAPDKFTFGLGLEPGMAWPDYLALLRDQRAGRNLPSHLVPSTFLVAEAAGRIVGRTSIRHRLNGFLEREGGHIGYCVLPPYRRRGYATAMLRQALVIARAEGVGRVLVTCDDANSGSAAVIERCGGRLDSVVSSAVERKLIRRYWID